MSYMRVIPRDFFNESKLLKCLGRFELCVLDRNCNGLPIRTIHSGNSFDIEQNPNDGSLFCSNYHVHLNGYEMHLFVPYNSKENYPLIARYRDADYYVFSEKGNFMPNFGVLK